MRPTERPQRLTVAKTTMIDASTGTIFCSDNARVYAECPEREVTTAISLRRNSGIRESSLPRKTDGWRRLYHRRSAVEREFDRLKHGLNLRRFAFAASSAYAFTPI